MYSETPGLPVHQVKRDGGLYSSVGSAVTQQCLPGPSTEREIQAAQDPLYPPTSSFPECVPGPERDGMSVRLRRPGGPGTRDPGTPRPRTPPRAHNLLVEPKVCFIGVLLLQGVLNSP